MKDLYKKLPSEEFAKKLIIVSLVTFAVSAMLIILTLFKVYSVAGNNLDSMTNTASLETYQTYTTILGWVVRTTMLTMIAGGIVVALQYEKKKPNRKN